MSIRTLFKNDSLEQIFRINTELLNTNSRDRKSEKTNKMYKYDRNKRKYTYTKKSNTYKICTVTPEKYKKINWQEKNDNFYNNINQKKMQPVNLCNYS